MMMKNKLLYMCIYCRCNTERPADAHDFWQFILRVISECMVETDISSMLDDMFTWKFEVCLHYYIIQHFNYSHIGRTVSSS